VPNKQPREPRIKSESTEVTDQKEPASLETMDTSKGEVWFHVFDGDLFDLFCWFGGFKITLVLMRESLFEVGHNKY